MKSNVRVGYNSVLILKKRTIFEYTSSSISCGVRQIYNLQNSFNRQNRTSSPFNLNDYKSAIEKLKSNNNCAHILASVNKECSKELIAILDSIALRRTAWVKNPNSGNMIRTYIL